MQSVFVYRATNAAGRLDHGSIDAASAIDARQALFARGLYVVSLDERGPRYERRRPIAASELALGLHVLADLLESGLSIGRALHAFEELAPRGWRAALPHLKQSIREGRGLSAALASAPIEIPALVVGIVQAGEAGSGIGSAMRRAAELTESSAELRASVRSALAYPMVVAAAGVLAIGVLVTVVLPRFAAILSDIGQTLPTSTRIVLGGAKAVETAFVPALAVVICGAIVGHGWASTERGRRSLHGFLLRVPVIGALRKGLATSRAAHSLAALLESGVAVATALPFAARAAGDAVIEQRLLACRASVVTGESLSRALEGSEAATLTAVRLIRAGEESGRVAAMLEHAARIERDKANRIIRAGVRMLEPILLLVFASAVALIAAALLQAVYSVRPA